MKILTLTEESKTDILENLLKRSPNSYGKFESQVAEIIENVRTKKDAALFDYTRRFDGADISADTILVTDAEIKEAYENVDTLKIMDGLVDVYLPDFKYMDGKLALKYSNAGNYPETAKAALREMVRQTGTPDMYGDDDTLVRDGYVESGIMKKGVIVRHLILPGYTKESRNVIKYLYDTYKNDIYISIMSQYTPFERLKKHPLLSRKVTRKEYNSVVDYAIDCGINNGFIQEGDVAEESFIPEFDYEGI